MYNHVTPTIRGCCFLATVSVVTTQYKEVRTEFGPGRPTLKQNYIFFQSGLIQSILPPKNIAPCPVEIGELKPLKYGI